MLKYLLVGSASLLLVCFAWSQSLPAETPPASPVEEESPVPPVHEIFEPLPGGEHARIVRVGKTLNIPEGAMIRQAIIIAGDVILDGKVSQDLAVVHGSVTFGEQASVGGDLILLMADATYDPAQVQGEIRQMQSGEFLSGMLSLLLSPPRRESDASSRLIYGLTGYRMSWGNLWLLWRLFTFATILLVHLLIVGILPLNMEMMARGFASRPLGSVILGLGVALLLLPVGILCVFSPFGIVVLLAVALLLVLLAIWGKTAILLSLGNLILQRERPNALAVSLGYLIYFLATTLPFMGLPTFLVMNFLSIGLCLRSRMGLATVPARRPYRTTEREVRTGWDSPVRGS